MLQRLLLHKYNDKQTTEGQNQHHNPGGNQGHERQLRALIGGDVGQVPEVINRFGHNGTGFVDALTETENFKAFGFILVNVLIHHHLTQLSVGAGLELFQPVGAVFNQ